jgi:hypothetical protein
MRTGFLEGFELEEEFASSANVHPRTIKRYRDQPNGLPYLIWGGKVYIPTADAREWLLRRVRHPNPTARKRVAA